jgi:hypothetical protein
MAETLPIPSDTTVGDFSKISSGTEETPSISFIDDNTTGIYLPDVGTISIVASETQCLNLTDVLVTCTVPLKMSGILDMNGNNITDCNNISIGNTIINSNVINTTGSLTLSSTSNQVLVNSNPTVALGVASKQYVDSIAAGLTIITPVSLVTDVELVGFVSEGAGIGKTLSAPGAGILTIDGVATVLNDRVLVNNIGNLTSSNCGIYYVSTEGTAGIGAVLTRATDFDETSELNYGTFVSVLYGTLYRYSGWVLIGTGPYVVDTSPQTWIQFTNNNISIIIENIGTAGVGLYKGLVGNSHQFKNINGGSTKISIIDDVGQNELDVDVVESNIVHNNLSGLTNGHPHTQYMQLTGDTMTGPIVLDAGIISAPGLTFDNSSTTGLYSSISGNIEVSSENVNIATFSGTGLQVEKIAINLTDFERHSITHNEDLSYSLINIAGSSSGFVFQMGDDFVIQNLGGTPIYDISQTGDISTTGTITINDDKTLTFGSGDDMQISHLSGTNNTLFANSNAAGNTIMRIGDSVGATSLQIQNSNNTAVCNINSNGDILTSGDITINDDKTLTLGNGSDMQISHLSGTNDTLFANSNAAGNTIIRVGDNAGATSLQIQNSDNTSICNINSNGDIITSGDITIGNITMVDDKTITLGTDSDMRIVHVSTTNDTLFVNSNAAGDTIFRIGDNIGATSLQIQNSDDTSVYNINSNGDITTIGNITMVDNKTITLGTGSDFTISHINGVDDTLFANSNAAGDTIFRIGDNIGATSLQIQNSDNTSVYNINSNGDITTIGNITMLDNKTLTLGTGSDFTISHINGVDDTLFDNNSIIGGTVMKLGTDNNEVSFNIRNSSNGVLFGVKGDGSFDIGAISLTTAELQQLATIGSNTISASQWGYLGGLDQPLTTLSTPKFGDLRIGTSSFSNKISFYGTTSDNLGGYDHTVIAERLYNGADQSELLLFKGSGGVGASHDKIRLRCSGDILFQTAASGEVYGTLADNTTRATISSSDGTVTCTSHIVSYGDIYNIFDNVGSLGRNTRRFTEVWSVDGTINTSDLNSKENIADSDLGLDFINRLRPISYKWKDYSTTDTVGINGDVITNRIYLRRHYGLISQEVGSVLSDISKPTNDFGGYIATADGTYALRYTEFIAPMMKAIQELSSSLTAALARIQVLEDL